MANLLAIVQEVADRIGLVRPTQVIGSSDHQVWQLLALANQEGRELARRHQWQALTFEKTFTTIAAETQTSAVPADFDRFVTGTFYNRSTTRMVTGPLTPQEYQDYKARLATIVYEAFRLRGNNILLMPTPSAGQTIVYEYVTKFFCSAVGDTVPDQAEWLSDTDIGYLDDELMRLGITWRFQRSRGLDYAETFAQYESMVAQLQGRDGGRRRLNMGGPPDRRVPRAPQAPDGNWNLS